MFYCATCASHVEVRSCNDVKLHLHRHLLSGKLDVPVKCIQGNCKSSFSKISNFIRHFEKYHIDGLDTEDVSASIDALPSPVSPLFVDFEDACEINNVDFEDACEINNLTRVDHYVEDIKIQILSMTAELRAKSSVPHSVVICAVESCCSIVEIMSTFFSNWCKETFPNHASTDVLEELQKLKSSISGLTSTYKINTDIENHELFLMPKTIVVGDRYEKRIRNGKEENVKIHNTFQYISLIETINVLFKNCRFAEKLMSTPHSTPDVIAHYCDGSSYKTNPLVMDESKKIVLPIEIQYDGMGATNPLRSGTAVIHNVGIFYFTIRNLSNWYNSSFPNVYLAAVANSLDLKQYGFNPVLECIMKDIMKLSTEGIETVIPNLGVYKVYAYLCHSVGDNLGINQLFGFVQSFSNDYCCPICYGTRVQMQMHFREEHFVLRTIPQYNTDIEIASITGKHSRGVKHDCVLNFGTYHVTQNFTNDIMHTVLEGIVPVEIGCILHVFINVKTYLSLEQFNTRLRTFFQRVVVDRKNAPCELNNILPCGSGLSPSMTATQYWSLLRYLPIILEDAVPDKDDHCWVFLLHLSQMVDLIFAPKFTSGLIAHLGNLIEDHLIMFKELFTDVSLKFKHHMLVHFMTIIRKTGPPYWSSCLKYELKNSFFKSSAHIIKNFKNLCYTLAYRHQNLAFYNLLLGKNVRDFILPGAVLESAVDLLPYSTALLKAFDELNGNQKIKKTNNLNYCGQKYKEHIAVVVDMENDCIKFLDICEFILVEEWCIVGKVLQNIGFSVNHHAHEVQVTEEYRIVNFKELIDFHPLDKILTPGDTYLIRCKYQLFK